MSPADAQNPRPRPTVFLSYAKEDRAAVQLIRDALPQFGLEAWYDESDLLGGDAWDQKIRRQIHDCDFFMPVVSAHTEARREGYFRREWRLAAERTLDMTDDSVFLVPVVIDDTAEAHARVPDKFRAVQWTRVPDGQPNAALEALCRRLVSGEPEAQPAARAERPPRARRAARARSEFPVFPREEPGQRARFWAQAVLWLLQSAWVGFQRFPKWVRVVVYFWIAIVILQQSLGTSHHDTQPATSANVTNLAQLVKLAQALKSGSNTTSAATASKQAAAPANPAPGTGLSHRASLLAIPFTAPSEKTRARTFAGTVFAKVYGRLMLTHQGQVALSVTPLPSLDSADALAQGRTDHSKYVLYGGIHGRAPKLTLTVRIVTVADGALVWSKNYPVAGANAARIASDTAAEVPKFEHD